MEKGEESGQPSPPDRIKIFLYMYVIPNGGSKYNRSKWSFV